MPQSWRSDGVSTKGVAMGDEEAGGIDVQQENGLTREPYVLWNCRMRIPLAKLLAALTVPQAAGSAGLAAGLAVQELEAGGMWKQRQVVARGRGRAGAGGVKHRKLRGGERHLPLDWLPGGRADGWAAPGLRERGRSSL